MEFLLNTTTLTHHFLHFWFDESGSIGDGDGDDDDDDDDDGGDGGDGGDDNAGGDDQQSILDNADDGDADGDGDGENDNDGGDYQAPDGTPDHLKGKDDKETLNKLLKAYQGARKDISKNKPGGAPETVDGYEFKPDGDDDKIATELNSEASKQVVDAFKDAAKEADISVDQLNTLMRKGLGSLSEQGVPIGVSEEEIIEISAKKEFTDLGEAVGEKQAGIMVNTVDQFGQKMLANGVFTDGDMNEFRVMVGTSQSVQAFYKIMTGTLGEKPIPPADGGEGAITQVEANALFADAKAMKDGPAKDEALKTASAAMERAYGSEKAGSIRTNIL